MRNSNNWPVWLPNLDSWMSAMIVALVTFGLANLGGIIWPLIYLLLWFLPRLGIVFNFLAYISPIFALAVGHHYFHLLLDKYLPENSFSKMGKVEGFIPGLISWWEGLYGWVVILLSVTVSNVIIAFLSAPWINPILVLNWNNPLTSIPFLPLVIRCLSAAYLYHFEYLVRQHWLALGSKIKSN